MANFWVGSFVLCPVLGSLIFGLAQFWFGSILVWLNFGLAQFELAHFWFVTFFCISWYIEKIWRDRLSLILRVMNCWPICWPVHIQCPWGRDPQLAELQSSCLCAINLSQVRSKDIDFGSGSWILGQFGSGSRVMSSILHILPLTFPIFNLCGSVFGIRITGIRIHKVAEYGSNLILDLHLDPQLW